MNQSDPLEVIDEIDSWLESTSRDDLMKPQRRVDVMFQLDGIGTSAARKLVREYLLLSTNDGRKNQKLWLASHRYWHQLADSYRHLIDQFEADKKLREDMKSSLPSMYARLLRAYGGCLKWDQFRYGPSSRSCGRMQGEYSCRQKKIAGLTKGWMSAVRKQASVSNI